MKWKRNQLTLSLIWHHTKPVWRWRERWKYVPCRESKLGRTDAVASHYADWTIPVYSHYVINVTSNGWRLTAFKAMEWANYSDFRTRITSVTAGLWVTKSSNKVASGLVILSRNQMRLVVGLLTGHCHLRKHLHRLGIYKEEPVCRKCGVGGGNCPQHLLSMRGPR
jgi:hypothetical protein